jgi:hypothetical protein
VNNYSVDEELTRSVVYEWNKLIAHRPLSDHFLELMDAPQIVAERVMNYFTDVVVVWPVAKRQLLSYQWPLTWWDAFKERWFPEWAKGRWPVRYKRIRLDELIAIRKDSIPVSEKYPLRYYVLED